MAGQPIRQVLSFISETFKNNTQVVPVAGTAVPLTATVTGCNEVCIQIKSSNTGDIWIGGATVASNGSTGGIVLKPVAAGVQPPSVNISVEDLNKLYINATVNGDGVTFLYW